MRAIPSRCWVYVVISAFLQVFAFPCAGPLHPWSSALAWIALTPFLAALLSPSRSGKPLSPIQSALIGYVCGFLWYLGSCYWIYQTMYLYGGLPKPVSLAILVLFACYLGLYHAAFAWLIAYTRQTFPGLAVALVATPFFWVAVELARARVTGFPWNLLGYSQVDNLLLTRLAPLAGVMAISFVLTAVNAAFVPLFVSRGRPSLALAAAGMLVAAGLQMGALIPASGVDHHHRTTQRATLLQENLAVGVTGRNVPLLSPEDELRIFSRWSENPLQFDKVAGWHPVAKSEVATVIVWPEAPSHLQSNDPGFLQAIADLARTMNSPVIAGSLGVDSSTISQRGYSLYDSASLFSADGKYQSRYDKIHLVPWGEYIPYRSFFSFARKLTEGVGDMNRGTRRTVFDTGGHRYGVFICYESIFGDEVRQFVGNGAEVLVNISDDGWYGDTSAPWQHLNMARMRAIENHRWLLRSTNTGITTAIDPEGRVAISAPRHVRAAFSFPFEFETGETFYTRHGDWFAWLCGAVSSGMIAAGIVRQQRRPAIV